MRKLTITRRKTFVACLMATHFYVTDPNGTKVISGANCSFLGKVKNGKSLEFEIPETAVTVAATDSLIANWVFDAIQIPAGTEDVEISGIHKFNPFAGNPFAFDKLKG